MGRLTKRFEDGNGNVKCFASCRSCNGCVCPDVYTMLDKLAHYEDLEEQGRLIEQKHGRWESLDSYVYECDGMWQCSECGEDFYFEFGTPLECRAYYCPNCGAKMESEVAE